MAAPKQMVDQVDDTADLLVESMGEVQTTMALLHATVGALLNSMSEILKSMSEMKAALQPTATPASPATESQVTVDQDLPVSPKKPSIAVDNTSEEKESRYTHLKKIQIEMPVFDGRNVDSWIPRAERYFKIGGFTEAEKLRLAYLSVDGEALSWFNLWERREPFLDWSDFKYRLLERFGDSLESGGEVSRLLTLKQVDSVIGYLGEFEKLASQSSPSDISDDLLRNLFTSGLKQEIKRMLPLYQPKGLNDMITKARGVENICFWNPPIETDDIN
uniref:Retrotransposon gag domain-containing protein n=1 Tax=Noccaea caerulescens TaxID=107243 RepID=A0A1J3CMQ5_NOCCA